jgi:hypothetical protein
MSINKTTNQQYDDNVVFWQKSDDVYNDKIKQKGKLYLPGSNLPPNCDSELTTFTNNRYLKETLPMAVFYNFTNLTLSAAIGSIMRKPPTHKFAEEGQESILDYLMKNADGKGNGLNQVARKLLTSQYMKSRGGLLISNPKFTNLDDLQSGKVAPRLIHYDALNIIDWETSYDNGQEVLTYLLLREYESIRDNGNRNNVERLIEFIKEEGVGVTYEITLDGKTIESDYVMKSGEIAQTIPFHLAGSVNNDWDVDPVPMRTMIDLNMLHYIMLSRDMQGRYDLAQLQLTIDIGSEPISMDNFSALNPNGVMSGSAVPIMTSGGSVSYLQASESNLLSKAPPEIEDMAVKAGAQLFQESGGNETATGAQIRASSTTATMSNIASNCGDCIYNAIVDLAGYLEGVNTTVDIDKIEFALNMEFFGVKLDANQLNAYTAMLIQGVFPQRAYFDVLKSSGDLPAQMTFTEYQKAVEDEAALGAMPDVSGTSNGVPE